jgi:hypothetical protein
LCGLPAPTPERDDRNLALEWRWRFELSIALHIP